MAKRMAVCVLWGVVVRMGVGWGKEVDVLVAEEGCAHASSDDVDRDSKRNEKHSLCTTYQLVLVYGKDIKAYRDSVHPSQICYGGRTTEDEHAGNDNIGGKAIAMQL